MGEAEFAAFRAGREAELVEPYGWLTLRGFHWLPSRPAALPDLPGRWWTDAGQELARLEAAAADGLARGGVAVEGEHADRRRVRPGSLVDHGEIRVELLRQ
ncbi:MAG: hypothetical protein R2734_06515 [Nocardioides sp.]